MDGLNFVMDSTDNQGIYLYLLYESNYLNVYSWF